MLAAGERVARFGLFSLPSEWQCESESAVLFYVTLKPVVS